MALTALIINKLKGTAPKGFVRIASSTYTAGGDPETIAGSYQPEQMALVLDANLLEQPTFKAEPTVSTVEDGASVSDHVTLKPITLRIEGIVSDTPIAGSWGKNIWKSIKAGAFGSFPSKDAHKLLFSLWKNRIPFDYVGGLQVYKNMVLSEYTPTRNAKTGGVLQFTATLQQVRIVKTKLVPSLKPSAGDRGDAKRNKGTQPAQDCNAAQQKEVNSWGEERNAPVKDTVNQYNSDGSLNKDYKYKS